MDVRWDIRREGRSWTEEEFEERVALRPEKLEVWEGKLLLSEEERLALLGLLLENVGADAAVKFGRPDVWADAVHGRQQSFLGDALDRQMFVLFLATLGLFFGLAGLSMGAVGPPGTIATFFVSVGVGLWASLFTSFILRD